MGFVERIFSGRMSPLLVGFYTGEILLVSCCGRYLYVDTHVLYCIVL